MTKLARLEVENFKRLVAVDLHLNDRVTEISGKNAAGKSSVIDSVAVLLQGLAVSPAVPVRRGVEECVIRGTLGDLIVERKFKISTEGKTTSTITLRTPEGARYPSPQKHLDELIGAHMLDPLEFIGAPSKKQFDTLRQFVPDIDFEAIDKANKADFDRRTEINRFAKEARAAAAMINIPADTPDEAIDTDKLVGELAAVNDANHEIDIRAARRAAMAKKAEELVAQSKAASDEAEALAKRVTELFTKSAAMANEAKEITDQLLSAPPLPEKQSSESIKQRFTDAQRINADVEKRAQKAKHEHHAIRYEQEAKDLTDRIDARTNQKIAAIAEAKIPVPGISFGDGEILLNGVPFSQASTAEKMRTAFALIVAMNPKVRIAFVRDASLLDDDSIAIIDRLAKEYDCQVLLETVRATSKNAIVLEDGRVKESDAKDDAA